ncbi:MAG: ATP-binding cassette domain-containing protein [Thermomicrobiales bacterium]
MTDSVSGDSGALIVRDLTKDFAGLRAVDGVSFTVQPGEIMGLIGPNGSGKTTTINVITGLLHITSGSVHLGTLDMTGWPPHKIARAGLARTFQIVRLFKDFTVRENVEVAVVASGGARGGVAADRATRAMRQLGILHLADLPARVLPQGEERLVESRGRSRPSQKFLLLDELGGTQ